MRNEISLHNVPGAGRSGFWSLVLLTGTVFLFLSFFTGFAQEKTPEGFSEESLTLRTTLHHDPMLPLPLDALVNLYSKADRIDELVGLYRNHVEEYPDDAGAKVVLIRILIKTEREGVGELIASASARHTDFAPLQYLLFQFLEEKGDERALEALSRAIDLQPNAAKRNQWLEELLQRSESETGRALASEKLAALLNVEGQTGEGYLSLAKLMQRYSFWNLSREALEMSIRGGLSAEADLEAGILLARAQAETGDRKSAGQILDGILDRLAPDHWRRQEVMAFRVSVIATDGERAAMLEQYRKKYEKNPKDESAALEYAELLNAAGKRKEAGKVLVQAAPEMGSGGAVETRALALLETLADPELSEVFLSERLEDDPERSDLRFRLVKARYALGKDADAEQDFASVVAGYEKEEASKRVLELQRYLRGIDRIDAASMYLARYVRNHPAELSVARELGEILVSREQREEVEVMVSRLSPVEAPPEQVRDLVEFLIAGSFFVPARSMLEKRWTQSGPDFDLGLLRIEVSGELGDLAETETIVAALRELTDTPERYARWLDVSVSAYEKFERLDEFFAREQNRFSFSKDAWPEEKVEKFVILCEIGKQRLLTGRVAEAVRERLTDGSISSELKIRLRRLLVGMLDVDPASSPEVVEQLEALAVEDPENRAEYDLRLALVHNRSSRVDLARDLLTGADLRGVTDASLVQEAVEVLIEYGFLEEAESALEAVNNLVPEDVFSWEKRLTLLAVLGREEDFRSVVRELKDGSGGLELSEDSRALLDQHFAASYWRSISRLIATRDARRFEEVIPMLESVNRNFDSFGNRAWTDWARAMVLQTLGRTEEAKEALETVVETAKETGHAEILFPDGMSLSISGAKTLLEALAPEVPAESGGQAAFLAGDASMSWAFSVEVGSRVVRMNATESTLLVLDNRDVVYAVDSSSGRLRWKSRFGSADRQPMEKPNLFFSRAPEEESVVSPSQQVKVARDFQTDGDLFVLQEEDQLRAYSVEDGSVAWAAELPFAIPANAHQRRSGAAPGVRFQLKEGKIVAWQPTSGELAAFDARSGKLLWNHESKNERNEVGKVISINSGISIDRGLVFAWGRSAVVYDLPSGKPIWKLSGRSGMTFPVRIRKRRSGASADLTAELSTNENEASRLASSEPVQFDFLSRNDRKSADFSTSVVRGSGGTELVNPAGYWANGRLTEGDAADARLEAGYLWLMRAGSVRRVSVRLPVAAGELPAEGSFVGRVGNHLWFIDGSKLHHTDFVNGRIQKIDCGDLGNSLRAVLTGNQLVARGSNGVRLINAVTGNVIGFSLWPQEMREFLAEVLPNEVSAPENSESLWQGEVNYSTNGEPDFCYPVIDQVAENRYFTRFGSGTLLCLERKPETKESGE